MSGPFRLPRAAPHQVLIDRLPFTTASVDALRANHALEHQSYERVEPTLREWARVMRPGPARRWTSGCRTPGSSPGKWARGGPDQLPTEI